MENWTSADVDIFVHEMNNIMILATVIAIVVGITLFAYTMNAINKYEQKCKEITHNSEPTTIEKAKDDTFTKD